VIVRSKTGVEGHLDPAAMKPFEGLLPPWDRFYAPVRITLCQVIPEGGEECLRFVGLTPWGRRGK